MERLFSKKTSRILSRITTYVVVLTLIVQFFAFTAIYAVQAAGKTAISMDGATNDLKILNNLQFVFSSADVEIGSGGYEISGSSDSHAIEIGDAIYEGTNYRDDGDIAVDLKGLSLGTGITVHKVDNGNHKVNLNVISESYIENLMLDIKANAVIELSKPVTFGKITLGSDASLTIKTNGNSFTANKITGGKLNVEGSGFNVKDIYVDEFSANSASLVGSAGSKITATSGMTITNSSFENFDYIGIHKSVSSAKTIELSGSNTVTNVNSFGAGTEAITYINGIDTLILNNSSLSVDYKINYYNGDTALDMENSWLASYRVKYSNSLDSGEIVAYHLYSGAYTETDPGLPSFTVEGYGSGGWTKTDGADESFTSLDNSFSGNIKLYAKLIEGSVTVRFDINYKPNQYTNDDYVNVDKVTTDTYQLGTSIDLPTPVRFGYKFTGWKVTTGSSNRTYNDNYVVAATDATDEVVTLVAQWKKATYPFRFFINVESGFDISRVKVTVGDKEYNSVQAFAKDYSHVSWNATDSMIQFDTDIEYGESFDHFFERIGLPGMPVLTDSVTGLGQMDFNGWHTTTGAILSGDMKYEMGSLLSKSDSQTLVDYDEMISLTPVFVTSGWGTASFNLTTDLPSGWEVLVNGVKVTDKVTTVESGATLTWRYSTATKTNFSYWSFSSSSNSFELPQEATYKSTNTHISFTTTMPNGNVTASFTDASANKVYVDVSKSSITFVESVKAPSGRTVNGFWYNIDMTAQPVTEHTYVDSDKVTLFVNRMAPLFHDAEKGYFYEYLTGLPTYITSCERATTNQVTLINTNEIYFRDINMVARPAYSQNFVGRKAYNTLMELITYSSSNLITNNNKALNGKDWSECGNIVISNKINKMYTTKLRFQGDNNTVASIMPSNCYVSADYAIETNKLYLYGDDKTNTTLELGNVTYLGYVYLTELTINEYDNSKHPDNPDNSEYLIYTATTKEGADRTYVYGSDIYARNKRLYNSFGYIYVERDPNKTSVSCNLFIGSAKYYYFYVRYNSYVRVYGDMYGMRGPLYMNENSSLVVDGSIYSRYSGTYNSAYSGDMTLASKGFLVIKGNAISGTNFSKTGTGVVITNAINGGRAATVSNGYVITNQMNNVVYQMATLDANTGMFTYPLVTDSTVTAANATANTNGDNYPFPNVSYYYAANNTYTWSGANTYTYLLGDYNTSISTYDNQSILWSKETGYTDNAVARVLKGIDILDDNGDLKQDFRGKEVTAAIKTKITTVAGQVYEEQVAAYGDNISEHENVNYGNTKFTGEAGTIGKKEFTITGGNIYSAGNMTLRNEATISGGNIFCGGTLSSKRDLTIKGGNITAKEVGNSCQVITQVNDMISRYSLLKISGGTIKTDKIGAITKPQAGIDSKSTIIVDGTFTLKKYNGADGNVNVCDNIKVNYIYSGDYSVPASNSKTTEYKGVVATGKISTPLTNLTDSNNFVLNAPIGSPAAVWRYDVIQGTETNSVTSKGHINVDSSPECLYNNKEYAVFYVTKESYKLTFKEGYDDFYLSSSFNDTAFNFSPNGNAGEYEASVQAGVDVTLQLKDPSMYDKTVVWYMDDSNVLHNAMPVCTEDGKVTFKMPFADTEIFVTNELKIYLDLYNISMTTGGFAVELSDAARREDSLFAYNGDLLITQMAKAATYNEMYWEAGSGNLKDDELTRKVTLKGVTQLIGSGDGTKIADNTKVQFNFIGENTMAPVKLPATSKVVFKGNSRTSETLYTSVLQSFEDYRFVGNNGAATGDVVFSDMKLHPGANSKTTTNLRIVKGTSTVANNNNTVSFINVDYSRDWASGNQLVYYSGSAIIDNCNFKIPSNTTSYTSYPFYTKGDVTVKNNSKITYSYGGTQSGYPIWSYVGGKFIVEDSEVTSTIYKRSATETFINNDIRTGKIVLNNGKLTTGEQVYFTSLELNGNSELNIGSNKDGYLLCRDIVVNDNSELNAGYVVVSGFTTTQYNDKNTFETATGTLGNFINGNSYPGLVVNGGKVSAKEFVGGDYNGKVTVNGGEIEAKSIGTIGARYGYKNQIPFIGDEGHVLIYEMTPIKGTVTLNDGTIIVLDGGYLGGINSVVDIKGGNVSLEGTGVIGLTDDQLTALEYNEATTGNKITNPTTITIKNANISDDGNGGINTPYSELNISGTSTAIDVNRITAKNGTVNIKEAKDAFENPYDGQEIRKPATVGVIVRDQLSGTYIVISDNASVYAYTAYARGDEEGKGGLFVPVSDGGLLSAPGAFGEEGIDDETLYYDSTPNSATQTIFGIRQVAVTYVLNPDDVVLESDVDNIINDNVSGYVVTSIAESIPIKNAECRGYYFRGWYTDPECTVSAGNAFNTSLANDITLYAKWEKVNVKFTILIDSSSTTYSLDGEFTEGGWTDNGDGSYIANTPVYVKYGSNVISNEGVVYGNFNTTTLGITSLEYMKDVYGGHVYVGPTSINTSTLVTKEIAEFYKIISNNGKDSDASIVLHINGVQKRFASITFSLNKKDGRPVDAKFDTVSSTILNFNAAVDKPIGEVAGFTGAGTELSSGLIVPKATGYTFIGWNLSPNATPDTVDGWLSADDYLTSTTTVYAVWKANMYLVRFSAGEGNWVTEDNTVPGVDDDEVKILDYYWIYDTAITDENSFWLKNKESHEGLKELPYAWRNGFKFDVSSGWTYTYEDATGTSHTNSISSTHELSDATIRALNTNVTNIETPAITFVARYTPVKVTYNLNGGNWTDENSPSVVEPDYEEALAGYIRGTVVDAENGEVAISSPITAENHNKYMIISTSGTYFLKNHVEDDSNSGYVDRDFRTVLNNKGYSFYGWYDSKELADLAGELPSDTITQDSIDAAQTKAIVTTPRFEDITIYASWHANSYYLDLYSYDYDSANAADEASRLYKYNKFNMPETSSSHTLADNDDRLIKVTTGEEIDAGTKTDGTDKWPSRNGEWYAYNNDVDHATIQEKDKRFLLGFTFVPLDPGSSKDPSLSANPTQDEIDGFEKYKAYANAVLNMQNEGSLFQNREQAEEGIFEGTDFNLPEDEAYQEAISGTKFNMNASVPDYPDGSIVKLYAVYRERSLVFVEQYIAPSGEVEMNYLDAFAWQYWSDYADKYGNGNPTILNQGYALIGWYVNGTSTSAAKYPMIKDNYPNPDDSTMTEAKAKNIAKDTYEHNCVTYKNNAIKLGTNDIFVYTIYVAQIKNDILFESVKKASEKSFDTNSYVLPESMQNGRMSLEITNPYGDGVTNKINIVSKEEMLSHQFDTTWTTGGKTYNANDTVAIELVLTNGEITKTYTLDQDTINTGLQISAGWKTTLNFYHSKVISESNEYELMLKMTFDNSVGGSKNTLSSQFVMDDIKVSLSPVEYEVNYLSVFPEDISDLVNLDLNGFTTDGTYKEDVAYGDSLTTNIPTFEGYQPQVGWTYDDSNDYLNLTMPVDISNNGVINLVVTYVPDTYKLSVDEDTLNNWTINYTDGAGSDVVNTLSSTDKVDVKYHSDIVFIPKNADEVPEFVSLNVTKDSTTEVIKLPSYSDINGESYIFKMPAADIDVDYIKVETLYLDNGTIEITSTGYRQNGVNHIWSGDYVILQCADNNSDNHTTENTLKIYGDLDGRQISLGNLNIISTNSIELSSDANVKLTAKYKENESTILAKNILVPEGSSFSAENGTYILNPRANTAGIGASTAEPINGQISLTDVNVKMTLPAGSVASGIGSGTQDATNNCGAVVISGSTIEATETPGTTPYTGAWIGGAGVSDVIITDTTVKRLDNSSVHMAGPNTISGKTVSISDSKVGTSDTDSVFNPIYAENKLNISSSEIHMMIQDNLLNNVITHSPVGTSATGTFNVTESNISVAKVGGSFEHLYTGKMILDVKSDVTISNTQILDVANGDITITSTGFTQDEENNSHAGNYMFIGEKEVTDKSDIIINSMANNATITVKKPTDDSDVVIGNISVNADATLITNANLNITGNAEVSDSTLIIKDDTKSGNTIKIEGSAFTGSTGTLNISDVNIIATDMGDDVIDVSLKDSDVTVDKLIAKDMVIDGGSVIATGNVGSNGNGVTSVEIKGGAEVTASVIGALGPHNESFTFVTVSEDSVVNGTLVQDWYRIDYDKSQLNIDVETLDTVFRTSTTDGSLPAVPANPTGADQDLFVNWFVWSEDGTKRIAITDSEDELAPGLDSKDVLKITTPTGISSDDVALNTDGTSTITLHAWATASGSIVVTEGRLFKEFTGSDTATIDRTNAFSIFAETNGNNIAGRDYELTFGQTQPAGTDLTLTVINTDGTKSHYYYKFTESASKVKFSEFKEMGSHEALTLPVTSADSEKFVIAVDYSETTMEVVDMNIKLDILPTRTSSVSIGSSVNVKTTEVSYGVVSANNEKVSVTSSPNGETDLVGKKLYLVAKLDKNTMMGSEIRVGNIEGQWITLDTALFEIGEYGKNVTFADKETVLEKAPSGDYNITWSMVYGDSSKNILGNTISTLPATGKVSVAAVVEPYLKVTDDVDTVTVPGGDIINYTYETNASVVKVKLEKQNAFGIFTTVGEETTATDGTHTLTIPSPKGVYRAVFSINDSTRNDNVYFSYIVD